MCARPSSAISKPPTALGQLGVNAASEAREAYGAYRATYAIARKYEGEVLPLAPDHLGGDRAAI